VASDATFSWNGGTGSASIASNWTLETGGVPNVPNIPESDDSIVISTGDAQFTNMPLPGQDNGTQGGTVFMQGGQIDLINSGSAGTAGILTNTLVDVTADATLTSSGATTLAGTIDSDTGNGVLAYNVLSGTATNTGTVETTNSGILFISTSAGASFVNAGTVLANSGTLVVTGSVGTGGYWAPINGGTLEVNAPVTSTSAIFDFPDGNNDILKLDQVATFNGDINEIGGGDTVDLGTKAVGTIVVASTGSPDGTVTMALEDTAGSAFGTLTLTPFGGGSFGTGTFAVTGGSADGFQFFTSGSDELMTACFAAGTRIATERGEVAVEDLVEGDRVHTVIGGDLKPVTWIGHRIIDCMRHPEPRQVWPVRIAAGTFGRARPSQDLYLSPDHAVYVEGVLIPVKYLINGSSIVQVPRQSVTYYHVELPQHDVLLACGMPAESYLQGATRNDFANGGGPVSLHPDMSTRIWEAEGCAPLVVTGPAFEAARRRVKMPGRSAQRKSKAA